MRIKAGERNIIFNFQLANEPLKILADEQQLEQVLINIVKNAIEAIEGEGSITFTTNAHPAQLIITDTGTGMNADVQEHLFSPFFSTKKDGQGVGLMLVREILVNHNFRFSLKTLEKGTTDFTITFS